MKTFFTLFFGVMLVSTSLTQFAAPAVVTAKTTETPGIYGVIEDENLIKNGYFDLVKPDGSPDLWGGWIDNGWGAPWTVENGAAAITSLKENSGEQWHVQFNQTDLGALPDIPYILSFVAWGSEDRAATVDFEDTQANGYKRYGTTSDPEAIDGSSEWHFNVTTTPKRFTFHVVFDKMVPTTVQKIQFMLTQDLGTFYLDSVSLVAEDVEIIGVDEINLTGGTITTDNGTLQIAAEILPENATNKVLKWSVEPAAGSTGRALITNTGLLSAILDGKVTVTAMSSDFVISTIDVEISGQIVEAEDFNIVKNGKFDELNDNGLTAKYWEGWTDASPAHTILDGVSIHTPVAGTANTWQYQFLQKNLIGLPDIDYEVNFTAWADVPRSINVDFEDPANSNTRYGSSTDPEAIGGGLAGRSDWIVNITTEPKTYTLHVKFDKIVPTTVQQISFFLGKFESPSTVKIDNVSVISVADMALLTAISQHSLESFRIYPNPAVNKLYIDLSKSNTVVAIYNSVGIKMEEVKVQGLHHTFNISSYKKGLYFVKIDSAIQKFVK